ncbi:DNA-binding MarR family transcriptional regulator [Rhodoblastus acidophilus]|uniref:hypothetical protein n=1 Tax=Rhodoblastus acidophilus TaxID=1074 RepID=UPI0022253960|nr:hypothetical protein [Rhodoblastus acidophilus]MCW2285622.1 DNA-binding MarR family transcriptional regulator [Rhodoblastus acidophilus]MCW2334620.1 DNA-binding MarR family transcriptional regulator [Rhodoblastus acidophilus]
MMPPDGTMGFMQSPAQLAHGKKSPRIKYQNQLALSAAAVLSVLTQESKKLPLSHYFAFLRIAEQKGTTVGDLVRLMQIDQSTVSRMTDSLSEWGRDGGPGLGLIESIDDPRERRRKVFFLTRKGRERINQLLSLLNADHVTDFEPMMKEQFIEEWKTKKLK